MSLCIIPTAFKWLFCWMCPFCPYFSMGKLAYNVSSASCFIEQTFLTQKRKVLTQFLRLCFYLHILWRPFQLKRTTVLFYFGLGRQRITFTAHSFRHALALASLNSTTLYMRKSTCASTVNDWLHSVIASYRMIGTCQVTCHSLNYTAKWDRKKVIYPIHFNSLRWICLLVHWECATSTQLRRCAA